jgi:effector-binding domain-containing protein
MKKIIVLISAVLILLALFFIPVTQQSTISIKSPFLTVYNELFNPENWKTWRPDLSKVNSADSNKIVIKKTVNLFTITSPVNKIVVKSEAAMFDVKEDNDAKSANYSYLVIPDTVPIRTLITVSKNINLLSYLFTQFNPTSFSDTHINDFKHFMETDSLYYGYRIFKTKIPGDNLIVTTHLILAKDKFSEAGKMLATLRQYAKQNNLKQLQPLIAQFLIKGNDSAQVKIGLFIDKEVKSDKDIQFTRMPKGGPLYAAKYHGPFIGRQKVYNGIHQFFIDHSHQSAVLPFETYLDDKLPTNDTSKINIQVNFTTYF